MNNIFQPTRQTVSGILNYSVHRIAIKRLKDYDVWFDEFGRLRHSEKSLLKMIYDYGYVDCGSETVAAFKFCEEALSYCKDKKPTKKSAYFYFCTRSTTETKSNQLAFVEIGY